MAVPLIDLPTPRQRVGNRYWIDSAPRAPQTAFCKDASQNFRSAVTAGQTS